MRLMQVGHHEDDGVDADDFVHHKVDDVRVWHIMRMVMAMMTIFVISFVTSLVGSATSNIEFCATWDRFLLHELSENMTF